MTVLELLDMKTPDLAKWYEKETGTRVDMKKASRADILAKCVSVVRGKRK